MFNQIIAETLAIRYGVSVCALFVAGAATQQYFIITSRLNGLVLDLERGNSSPGTRVMPWPKHGKDNQLWYDDLATGTIRSKLSGLCLDIEST